MTFTRERTYFLNVHTIYYNYSRKVELCMQNYRNNAMAYNNYRQTMPIQKMHEQHNDMVLAMAYVPWQKWQMIYDAEKGLHRGTIFQELDLPFCGMGGCQK